MIRQPATRPLTALVTTALLAGCTTMQAAPAQVASPSGPASTELVEQAIVVPGFADFLAVDGDTVWVTNAGRVEQWATGGLKASFAVPRPCGTMAIAAGSLWVANCPGAELYRINLATAALEATIPSGIANPKGETNVVAGAGSVWVPSDAGGKVARIDPATNEVTALIAVTPQTWFLAFGFGAVWAVSSEGQTLQRIDPETNTVTGTVAMGKIPGFLAAGEGAVWVQEQGDGTVARVDPESLEITGRAKVGEVLKYGDIDTGGGAVWLRTTEDQTLVVIDPQTLAIRARLGGAVGSGALRYTPDGLWTSAHDNQTLSWWSAAE